MPCAFVALRWLSRDDGNSQSNILISPIDKERLPTQFSKVLLIIITLSSVTALSPSYMGSSAFALCLCNILLTSLAYSLLEDVINGSESGLYDTANGHATPTGLSSPRQLHTSTNSTQIVLQNVSAIIALGCAVASILLETHAVDGLTYRRELSLLGGTWKRDMRQLDFGQGFSMCLVGALKGYLTISTVSRNPVDRTTGPLVHPIVVTHTKLHAKSSLGVFKLAPFPVLGFEFLEQPSSGCFLCLASYVWLLPTRLLVPYLQLFLRPDIPADLYDGE